MRKNISRILDAFAGHYAAGDKTCSTDGQTVYSYALPIMTRRDDGSIEIRERWPTQTTTTQINACVQRFPGAKRVLEVTLAVRS